MCIVYVNSSTSVGIVKKNKCRTSLESQYLRQQTARHYSALTSEKAQGGGGKNRFSE
jgi:hypothetical protein